MGKNALIFPDGKGKTQAGLWLYSTRHGVPHACRMPAAQLFGRPHSLTPSASHCLHAGIHIKQRQPNLSACQYATGFLYGVLLFQTARVVLAHSTSIDCWCACAKRVDSHHVWCATHILPRLLVTNQSRSKARSKRHVAVVQQAFARVWDRCCYRTSVALTARSVTWRRTPCTCLWGDHTWQQETD